MKQWPTASLGDIAGDGQYGLNAAAMPEGQGVRFVRITDITEEGGLRHETPAFVSEATPELNRYELDDGDVLIARSGATAGKSYVHQSFNQRSVFAGYLIRFKPDRSKVLPRYIGSFLKTADYWRQLNSHKRAVAQPNVNAKQLASLVLPLPPLPEQERLVKLLDEADALRKLRAQADRRTADLIPALFREMFGDPVNDSEAWPHRPLGEVVNLASGATPSKENDLFWKGETPWVSPKDMKRDELADAEDHVSEAAFAQTNLQLIPKDTVLIVVRGMILAHTVPIGICRVPVGINQDMKALLPVDPVEPAFLQWALRARHGHLLNQVSTAGHGTKRLDSERLKAVPVPQPPLSLQREFVARVAAVRSMESSQVHSRSRLDSLFQSMLRRAFNGEL